MTSANISRLDARFMFSLDARAFTQRGPTDFVLNAHGRLGPDETLLRSVLPASAKMSSAFQLASRPEKNTLPEYDFEAFAPAVVTLPHPLTTTVDIFTISLDRFFVSPDSALAYSFNVSLAQAGDHTEMPRLVEGLTEVRRALRHMLVNAAVASFEALSEAHTGHLTPPSPDTLMSCCHSFELFDFTGSLPAFDDLQHDRSLAGFIRMTRPGVWRMYSEESTRRLFASNLGNRTDELWLGLGTRFFRMHPESTTRQDVQLWFEDLHLAITILLQKIATLEFLCATIRRSLRELPSQPGVTPLAGLQAAWRHLTDIQAAAARSADPRFIERNVAHSFFRKVLQAIESEVGFYDLIANTTNLLADYRESVNALATQSAAVGSLEIARSTQQLTRYVLWLTGAAVLVMLGQVWLALVLY